ncbi:NAD(P)/FAD-dependent oxidoreductase [Georgenia sp. MJ170]|uniref:NAD(P)/FAD-dependent oxidoreductase n=1 Tax=Georgenia sunbinii TaxID=3117728 RepID=UPI002F2625C4
MSHQGTVVVGAGLAGAKVVEQLRAGGYDAPVTLVGDEGIAPYERPQLSKDYLQGNAPFAVVHPVAWYDEHDITTHLDDAARVIDREAHEVVLTSGARLGYTHLVLATGSEPRALPVPGADLDGVLTLRRLPDSDAIRTAIAAGGRMVLVGGGWIGLEVAAAARLAGLDVTVLETDELPLQRILGPVVAGHFAQLHRDHGVDLRTSTTVTALEGAGGRVTGVVAAGGTIPADVVVVGIGAAPNVALARDAGLPVGTGVLVDEHLRSSDPAVLAVGDIAEAHNLALGRRLRVEHWDNAIRQGALAARVILGEDAGYDWQPYFFTDQYELGMEYVGHGGGQDDVTLRGSLSSGEFLAFWHREGTLTAAMNVNIWDVNDDLRTLLGRRIPPTRLADEDIALTGL